MNENLNDLNQAIGHTIDNWQACKHPPRSAMIGDYCKLESIDIEYHATDLYQAYITQGGLQNWTYLAYGPFNDFEAFSQWIALTCLSDDPLFYAVIDSQTQKAVGLASYLRIEPAPGVVEVGHIHFSPLLQKKPAATEVMYLMMRRVFDELGYRRYEWKCDALNPGSRQAAMRLGFTFEGVFRQATMYKGRNRDTAWYSVIDKEWPAIKAAFESWLDPINFDAKGQQFESLASFRPRHT